MLNDTACAAVLTENQFQDNLDDVSFLPRHKFLWWRWGTKGYEVRLVNFNPHAHVTYNRYIKAGK